MDREQTINDVKNLIDELFGDKRVSKRITDNDLRDIMSYIAVTLDALDADSEMESD